jgi:hypothetical protein
VAGEAMSRATSKDLAVRAAIGVTYGAFEGYLRHHGYCPVKDCKCGLEALKDEYRDLMRTYTERDATNSIVLKHAMNVRAEQGR